MPDHPIVVATANPGKCREIGEMLRDMPLALTSLGDHWDPPPEIPENGETFLENAFAKADWVFSRIHDAWVLADDSGLEVDFLSGDPGVRSARYAGPHANDGENNRKLLDLLSACPPEQRTARFRCVMVLRMSRSDSLIAEGVCEGMIGHGLRGIGGFGYDPVFTPAGENLTFAELDPSIKNRISHRGKALAELRRKLGPLLGR